MASGPGQAVLGWVAGVLGTGPPEVVCGLRDGASPWLLRAGGREVVLRVGRPAIAHELATEAAALELAAEAGVSMPELLGSDDGRAAGVPVVLSARLPGSSQIPREPDPARLAKLGPPRSVGSMAHRAGKSVSDGTSTQSGRACGPSRTGP
jgi:hypothetical protein